MSHQRLSQRKLSKRLLGDGVPADPYWNDVVLLLHFDGEDNSTVFMDAKGHAVTANGAAEIITAQSVFGGASMASGGPNDYLSVFNNGDFDFGADDWTIEGRVRLGALGGYQGLFCKRGDSSSEIAGIIADITPSGQLEVVIANSSGSGWQVTAQSSATLAPNSWNFFAICRQGPNLYLDVNGIVQLASSSLGTNAIFNIPARPFLLGRTGTTGSYSFGTNGNYDEWRITRRVARYTANHPVPSEPYRG